MNYAVVFDPKAEKQLEKLDQATVRRVLKKIREAAESGRGMEALRDAAYGYKIRVGDYRILIDMSQNQKLIWVRMIDHRKRVYKRM